MKKITTVLFLFISLLQAQNLDIGQMNNSDLDKLRESLKEQQKFEFENSDDSIKSFEDVKLPIHRDLHPIWDTISEIAILSFDT